MSEKQFVSQQEVAAVVAVVAEGLAGSDRMPIAKARELLGHWFSQDEVSDILALITGLRIRCRRCNKCVSASGDKSDGAYCRPCSRIEIEEGAQP